MLRRRLDFSRLKVTQRAVVQSKAHRMATNTLSTKDRAYSAAHFALELDGKKDDVGLFRSVEGGSIKADVMTYQNGANYDRWRQLGKPKFEDIKVSVGMSMSQPFYTWIADFFTGAGVRKTGAILAADFNYEERARREFSQALIKEITIPKLDATDKSPAYMGIAIAVEELQFKKGDGSKLLPLSNYKKQKQWTACNFKMHLDAIPDAAMARITKIDSFTIKQNIVEHHMGGFRGPIKCPSQMDFPTLSFYIPEVDAFPLMEHFTKRGVKGEVPGRMTGSIDCLDNELKSLFTISFAGADITTIQPEKSDSGAEEIKVVKVDLYTESMKFSYKL
jgi:phage tail-like protein